MVSVIMSGVAGGAPANVTEEFCTVKRLLVTWHHECSNKGRSYIELLNECLQPACPVKVAAAAERVEGRLRRRGAEVTAKSRKLSRRKKDDFLNTVHFSLTLGREEVVNPQQLQQELDHASASLATTR